jgi:phosphoglycolate phosphatase-like HAD superfamily hydrolase
MTPHDPAQRLRDFTPAHEFFVGIDSDGCVFDTMGIKHRECFVPLVIEHFDLAPVADQVREVWEFVNLYSKSRGINRYPALSNVLNLLAERPDVRDAGVAVPATDELDAWMALERNHSLAALATAVEHQGNTALQPFLDWSRAVDAAIEQRVRGVPPFPGVRECLTRLQGRADVAVVSQTPGPALEREWSEHDLARFVTLMAGQEMGAKKDHLRLAAVGKYPPARILLIGDAFGDFTAAKTHNALFFPILPGHEEASWRRLLGEGLEAFFSGAFSPEYEAALFREFQATLPEHPSW